MRRLLAVVVAFSIGQMSVVFAAEPTAAASAEKAAPATSVAAPAPMRFKSFAEAAHVGSGKVPSAALAQQSGAISQTGMGKSTKIVIFAAVAGAFVGSMWGIDHGVKDVTPSSLGQRHDEDVFKK